MKLRFHGNSLRLRLSKSEVARFLDEGRIVESVHFTPQVGSDLTYSIAHSPAHHEVCVRYLMRAITVEVPTLLAQRWADSDEIGFSTEIHLGPHGTLSVLVEKDFACLDRPETENADTFPNPLNGTKC